MSVTKKQLRDIVRRVKGQATNEALAVSGDEYWKMRDQIEKDMSNILGWCDLLEDALYSQDEPGGDDPFDIVDEIRQVADKHVR